MAAHEEADNTQRGIPLSPDDDFSYLPLLMGQHYAEIHSDDFLGGQKLATFMHDVRMMFRVLQSDKGHLMSSNHVAQFIATGTDFNSGDTILMKAAEQGLLQMVDSLIACGAEVNHKNKDGNTAVLLATKNEHTDVVEFLIKAGADVNATNVLNESSLSSAVSLGNDLIVELLVCGGADVNHQHNNNMTYLHYACRKGKSSIVRCLLDHGANVEMVNSAGCTPLMVACQYAKANVVMDLLRYGANLHHRCDKMNTALFYAAQKNCLEACKDLISFGAEIDAENNQGITPMIEAITHGNEMTVKFLLEAGANVNFVNKHLRTALSFAVHGCVTSCTPILLHMLDAGADIDMEFHQAVGLGLKHVVLEFLHRGAFPFVAHTGQLNLRLPIPLKFVSPLAVALIMNRLDIAWLLIDVGYLTDYDLYTAPVNTTLRDCLKDKHRYESIKLLDSYLKEPYSLECLTLVGVSRAIGFQPKNREERVRATGLPPMFQRKLLYDVDVES